MDPGLGRDDGEYFDFQFIHNLNGARSHRGLSVSQDRLHHNASPAPSRSTASASAVNFPPASCSTSPGDSFSGV